MTTTIGKDYCMTRAMMRDTGETDFRIQVWNYLNWALGDRDLGFGRRLHWMGEPVSVTTFQDADKPLPEVAGESRTVAADNDMRVWVAVQHVTGMNIPGSLVLIPPEAWTRLSQLDANRELDELHVIQPAVGDGLGVLHLDQFALLMNHLQPLGPDDCRAWTATPRHAQAKTHTGEETS